MTDASTLTARTIGGREIVFRELTVAAARQMFGNASDDVFGSLLFPQCSLEDVRQMTNLTAEDIEAMRPSELREVIQGCQEQNPDFFEMLARLSRVVPAQ